LAEVMKLVYTKK